MILEGLFKFDPTPHQLTAAGAATDVIGTNVFDAGAAKVLFPGHSQKPPMLSYFYQITAGTGAMTFRCRLVGADNALLTTKPEIIVDTGIQGYQADGATGLAIGSIVSGALTLRGQRTPKRYYGVFATQGTADQDGKFTAVVTEGPQTQMPALRQAVPS